jgi:hypothetical protein
MPPLHKCRTTRNQCFVRACGDNIHAILYMWRLINPTYSSNRQTQIRALQNGHARLLRYGTSNDTVNAVLQQLSKRRARGRLMTAQHMQSDDDEDSEQEHEQVASAHRSCTSKHPAFLPCPCQETRYVPANHALVCSLCASQSRTRMLAMCQPITHSYTCFRVLGFGKVSAYPELTQCAGVASFASSCGCFKCCSKPRECARIAAEARVPIKKYSMFLLAIVHNNALLALSGRISTSQNSFKMVTG